MFVYLIVYFFESFIGMIFAVFFIMFKKTELVNLSKYAIIPAVLYCIPLIFFIKNETYTQTWLLYFGNALFLACIFIFGVIENRKKNTNSSIPYNGWTVTIIGVSFSCILILLFLLAFYIGSTREVLQQTPAAISHKNTHGLLFMLFANALMGNFAAGAFATLMAKSASQKDQVAS